MHVPERTKGACCGSVRSEFPDIEELGVRVGQPYCHAQMRHQPNLPAVSKLPLVVHSKKDRSNTWISVSTLPDLFSALASAPPSYMLVVGNTSSGIYPMPVPVLSINIAPVASLYGITKSGSVKKKKTLKSFLNNYET